MAGHGLWSINMNRKHETGTTSPLTGITDCILAIDLKQFPDRLVGKVIHACVG